MKLEYSMYFKNDLVLPAVLLIALVAFLIVNVCGLVGNIKKSEPLTYSIFAIVCAILVIIPNAIMLSRGVLLISEKESDAISIEGEVTGIEFAHNSPRYYINGEARHGVWIYVDGEKYYMANTEELSVGERVELRYLERSRLVLESAT